MDGFEELESRGNVIVFDDVQVNSEDMHGLYRRTSTEDSEILVVVTVDGSLHGIDKATGRQLWRNRDDWGSLVSVNQYFYNSLNLPVLTDKKLSNDDILIVEPVGNGNIYRFKPGESLKHHFSSVKELVDLKTSFFANEAYVGRSESRIMALDPVTGKILRVFGDSSRGDVVLDKSNFDVDLNDAVFLGRT
ncbi:bifunctional endoribonuclease/protein kinase ire1, partial [Nowakowskiella sp. JEL0078]